jgi:hypothetical protein
MKTVLTLTALVTCSVAGAQTSDTHCQQIGQHIYCHTQEHPAPSNSFDPSVISRMGDETDSSKRMQCVLAGKNAGMTRAQIVALCFH